MDGEWQMLKYVYYTCNGTIQGAGLHPVSNILGLIFGRDWVSGKTSQPIKEIGFTQPVTGIASLVTIRNFV